MANDVAALAQVLENERRILIEGRWSDLDRLAPEKERLLQGVKSAAAPAAELRRIAQLVDRNQRLLHEAIAGTRDAVTRLHAIRDAQDTLRTYDAAGRGADLAPRGARGLERKA